MLVVLILSVAITYICYLFNLHFDVDLTLLSIAIVFPLVFSIRGSFRRREKALEHLSQFRASLKTVHYFVMSSSELSEDDKKEMSGILSNISDKSMDHLSQNHATTKDLDGVINQVHQFIQSRGDTVSRRLSDKVFRFMNDLHESIENLHAINIHRTPISLKAYCLIFIYIFPFIYAPSIIKHIGPETSPAITYFVVALTEFILVALYNIQDQLEYPFDDVGLDDIKLDTFKIDR